MAKGVWARRVIAATIVTRLKFPTARSLIFKRRLSSFFLFFSLLFKITKDAFFRIKSGGPVFGAWARADVAAIKQKVFGTFADNYRRAMQIIMWKNYENIWEFYLKRGRKKNRALNFVNDENIKFIYVGCSKCSTQYNAFR